MFQFAKRPLRRTINVHFFVYPIYPRSSQSNSHVGWIEDIDFFTLIAVQQGNGPTLLEMAITEEHRLQEGKLGHNQDVIKDDTSLSSGSGDDEQKTFLSTGLEENYAPIDSYEGRHRYDPTFRWSEGEETKLVRKVSLKFNHYRVLARLADLLLYYRLTFAFVHGSA